MQHPDSANTQHEYFADRPGFPAKTIVATLFIGAFFGYLKIDTQTTALSAMFALMAVSVSACITGETHGLNALPKHLNPHGAAIITAINPIAGAIGAAFFVGTTNIGERLSRGSSPQQAMLNGIHLSMSLALAVGILTIVCAYRLKPHSESSD